GKLASPAAHHVLNGAFVTGRAGGFEKAFEKGKRTVVHVSPRNRPVASDPSKPSPADSTVFYGMGGADETLAVCQGLAEEPYARGVNAGTGAFARSGDVEDGQVILLKPLPNSGGI